MEAGHRSGTHFQGITGRQGGDGAMHRMAGINRPPEAKIDVAQTEPRTAGSAPPRKVEGLPVSARTALRDPRCGLFTTL